MVSTQMDNVLPKARREYAEKGVFEGDLATPPLSGKGMLLSTQSRARGGPCCPVKNRAVRKPCPRMVHLS